MTNERKHTTREGHTICAEGIYSSLESARRHAFADTRVGRLPCIVQVGRRFWHVSGRDASRLVRDGFEQFSLLQKL